MNKLREVLIVIGAAIGLGGIIVVLHVLARLWWPETMVNKEPTVQQIACVNGGYLSFVATDVYFSSFSGGVVTFKDRNGVLVAYNMGPGEYCGWNPRTKREDLVGLAPETLDD